MEKTNRELTAGEKSRIKKLVKANCANYDSEYGCLPYREPRKTKGFVGRGGAAE